MATTLRYVELATQGEHVHVNVYVGPDEDHLALSGQLVFRVPEWEDFTGAREYWELTTQFRKR